MVDPISVAGLALSVFSVLDVVLKTVRAMSDEVSSSGGILQNRRLWIRVQQIDLDGWLGYWGINTKDGDISSIDDRLEIYWGRDGRIAIYEILQRIEAILQRLKTLEASYPATSSDPSAPTKWRKWVHATKVGFRFAFRDGNEFKELWEDLERWMFCLNATSRRWFEQRHPDCQKPQDTEVKIGPNSVTYIRADMIRQASRGLFEYFEVSGAIAPVQVELALVGERIDCSIFKGLLHPDSVLVPETVKFPITLELKTSTADASTGEYTVVQILVEAAATYGNEQATEVREEAQTLVNWTFGQLQKSESSSTSVGAQNTLPASPSAARRFHKLKSISHSTHRSLLQILESGPTTVTGYLPTVKRFELAYLLSLSVFQLHSSWTSRLNSRNIRVDDFSHFIIPDERKEAPHKRLPFDVFRHSRTDIFDLGVVLWEIGKGQPLDKRIQNKDEWLPCSWDPEDANSHRQKALADYLLDEVGPHMGIIYQEIVEWCFKVDFDNDPLGKDDIMRTFYCTVVEPLKETYELLSQPKRRRARPTQRS